ncbi:helix-turn-helix domain-containing protein [Halofilum ochraceum]|uniref:helix-turn-helix domain-containing protein n=1 Tax=Halofilum ochraceum TaxID=1611323 RepID=UPI0008D9CA51|nr:XRE family transcriptional regulator [Halofilum ochraceum]
MNQGKKTDAESLGLIPDTTAGVASRDLEKYVGAEIRRHRRRADLTIVALAQRAGLSQGMMSKIENGQTSPSLSTLSALADALGTPLSALFAPLDTSRDVSFVPAGTGLEIDRRGTKSGHLYELLGHGVRNVVGVEPYRITLSEGSEPFGDFQHEGVEFIYMLEGRLIYRHGERTFPMGPGDALFFDSIAPHGPIELVEVPCRYLSVITYSRDENAG